MRASWIVVVGLLSCGKKDAGPSAKPAETFKGPLTIDMVMAGKVVRVFQPWDEGYTALQAQLGPPTKIDKTKYEWAVQQGDECAYFYVTKDDGKQYKMDGQIVGTIMTPMRVGKDSPSGNRDECLAVLGKDKPPEDPNAAGPPTDGSAVGVGFVRDNALKAQSKWEGKQIKVSGDVGQISTQTMNGQTSTSVALDDHAHPLPKPVRAELDPASSFKTEQGKQVTLQCTVHVEKWESMGSGATTFEVALDHCNGAS